MELLASRKAFERLPSEIIKQILYLADPDSFSSLIWLNHEWHHLSQSSHLYAHQLSRCFLYSLKNRPDPESLTEADLPGLRKDFERQRRCNLFNSFLRPSQTVFKLVSTSASSSAAFPGGESFLFSFSPNGHFVLALSSSRIYLIDVVSPIVVVRKQFKVLRRPVSAAILNDASTLAVLSTDHQVNIYDLKGPQAKHLRSVPLDNPPRTIALSPGGSVLAAAYDGGIEVYSLANQALSTDRRAVKCGAVDFLSFSNDGTLLLGTTLHSKNPSTVVLSAPYYNEGSHDVPASELLSQMWTTQILFPNSSRDCSHATLIPHTRVGEDDWMFTHDKVFETFRSVRIDDLRNGTIYFTGPTSFASPGNLVPSTLPAASENGEIVAAGFSRTGIWLYGLPEDQGFVSDTTQQNGLALTGQAPTNQPQSLAEQNGLAPTNSTFPSPRETTNDFPPQWHTLSENPRNTVIKGQQLAAVDGMTALKWVSSLSGKSGNGCAQRLIAVAPGGVSQIPETGEDEMAPIDGGRIVVFDFVLGAFNGKKKEIIIELGDSEPDLLEEERIDLEAEVAIVRRRTVAQRRTGLGRSTRSNLERASTTLDRSSQIPDIPPMPHHPSIPSSATPSSSDLADPSSTPPTIMIGGDDEASYEEVQEALDGPYSHTQPRSRTTLHRAATAAAANRRNNPVRIPDSGRVEYRRADGRREIPHESDADNWVPPPPPYTPNADTPLPEHLRLTLMPSNTFPIQRVSSHPPSPPVRAHTSLEGMTQIALQRTRSTMERAGNSLRASRPYGRRGLINVPALPTPNRQYLPQSATASSSMPIRASRSVSPPSSPPRPNVIPRRPVPTNSNSGNNMPPQPNSSVPSTTRPQSNPQPTTSLDSALVIFPAVLPHEARPFTDTHNRTQSSHSLSNSSISSVSTASLNDLQNKNLPHPPTDYEPGTANFPTLPTNQHGTHAPDLLPLAIFPHPDLPQTTHLHQSNPAPPQTILNTRETPYSLSRSSSFMSTENTRDVHFRQSSVSGLTIQPALMRSSYETLPSPSATQLENLHNRYSLLSTNTHSRPQPATSPIYSQSPAPRAAQGALTHSSRNSNPPLHPSPSARHRSTINRALNRRPVSLRRLDTIHSVASRAPSQHSRERSRDFTVPPVPGRHPSRAGRSAAINIQEAKQRGWSKPKRKRKKNGGVWDDTSEAWTDVTARSLEDEGGKGNAKCLLM
ncbi:MAG: hypothetical protein M1829_000910 [Trizodia sp. TS-e1964]|nr:MAG: hypothetical protein M1829_000910 [Trizodia sp. TS-e1964]